MMYVKFIQDSYFKKNTKQSNDPLNKVIKALKNTKHPVKDVDIAEDNHLLITLVNVLDTSHTWYVFAPHIDIVNDKDEVVTLNLKGEEETVPNTSSKDPEDTPIPAKPTARMVTLPYPYGKVDLNASIIPNGSFTWAEALHNGERIPKNGGHVQAIIRLATEAQKVRNRLAKPMHITSWYRPEPFNSRAGGAKKSMHLGGAGLDFYVEGLTGSQLYSLLDPVWNGGLGMYKNKPRIVHIDVRGYKARWKY